MKTYAARKDGNDADLTKVARRYGAFVLHMEPDQGFDWLLFHQGHVFIVEIKDGEKPPSKRVLTPTEKKLRDMVQAHGVSHYIVKNEAELLTLLT